MGTCMRPACTFEWGGGGEGPRSSTILLRWCELDSLCPKFRLSSLGEFCTFTVQYYYILPSQDPSSKLEWTQLVRDGSGLRMSKISRSCSAGRSSPKSWLIDDLCPTTKSNCLSRSWECGQTSQNTRELFYPLYPHQVLIIPSSLKSTSLVVPYEQWPKI